MYFIPRVDVTGTHPIKYVMDHTRGMIVFDSCREHSVRTLAINDEWNGIPLFFFRVVVVGGMSCGL